MASIDKEIKRIAIECTTDVVLKVTSGVYNYLMLKFNRLENAVETLQCENRDLKAEVRKVHNKCKCDNEDATSDKQNTLQNRASGRKRKKQLTSSSSSCNQLDQLEESTQIQNPDLVEEDNNIMEGAFSNKNEKRRKFYNSWSERMAHLLQLRCLRWTERRLQKFIMERGKCH